MLVALDDYRDGCWVHDDDLARLLDDGCPWTQEARRTECGECGGTWLSLWREHWTERYECLDCGVWGEDDSIDVYGTMSVPYGYL